MSLEQDIKNIDNRFTLNNGLYVPNRLAPAAPVFGSSSLTKFGRAIRGLILSGLVYAGVAVSSLAEASETEVKPLDGKTRVYLASPDAYEGIIITEANEGQVKNLIRSKVIDGIKKDENLRNSATMRTISADPEKLGVDIVGTTIGLWYDANENGFKESTESGIVIPDNVTGVVRTNLGDSYTLDNMKACLGLERCLKNASERDVKETVKFKPGNYLRLRAEGVMLRTPHMAGTLGGAGVRIGNRFHGQKWYGEGQLFFYGGSDSVTNPFETRTESGPLAGQLATSGSKTFDTSIFGGGVGGVAGYQLTEGLAFEFGGGLILEHALKELFEESQRYMNGNPLENTQQGNKSNLLDELYVRPFLNAGMNLRIPDTDVCLGAYGGIVFNATRTPAVNGILMFNAGYCPRDKK